MGITAHNAVVSLQRGARKKKKKPVATPEKQAEVSTTLGLPPPPKPEDIFKQPTSTDPRKAGAPPEHTGTTATGAYPAQGTEIKEGSKFRDEKGRVTGTQIGGRTIFGLSPDEMALLQAQTEGGTSPLALSKQQLELEQAQKIGGELTEQSSIEQLK